MAACLGLVAAGGLFSAAVEAEAAVPAGAPTEIATLPLGDQAKAGLSISQGLLRHVEAVGGPGDPSTRYLLHNHTLFTGTDGNDPASNGGDLIGALSCDAAVACVRTVDGNGYGTAYLAAGTKSKTSVLTTTIDFSHGPTSATIPSAPGRIVDASTGWVVVNGTNPVKQYVVDLGHGDVVARPVGGAALWFDTLWTSPKSGYVMAKNLATGKSATAVRTGAPCVAAELQATGRYIYWSCGANGPAGVYDRTHKKSTTVPAGQSLLGDGYLVRHDSDSGELVRHDLATGTPATVTTMAPNTLTDQRGITWAVDRFGGDIAYVDAAGTAHVVDPGVAPSAPAAGTTYSSGDGNFLTFDDFGGWTGYYDLTRPVAGWAMTMTRISTGKVVATETGGPTRIAISTTWDGYLAKKKKAASGRYRYTVTVRPTDGAKPVTINSGVLVVMGGTPNQHSYSSTGETSVLGIKPNGEGHWLWATSGKGLRDWGYTDEWSWGSRSHQINAMVPFGDFNNDGSNDLIARSGTGVLRAYLGIGGGYSDGKKVTIGKGWNGYNAILSSGDLTGDGNADLLARDKKGKLWRYNGTGKKKFAARVALAGNYKSYSRVIGPGDINGDGRADLLVVRKSGKKSGEMYSAYGTGKGTFGKQRKVSAGWKKYKIVIGAGDLNEDSHPDLLARDSAGVLWRYLGTGKGGFATRQKLGSGYKKFARLF